MEVGLARENLEGARFIIVEERGTLPVKEYNEDTQEILAVDGESVGHSELISL